MIKYQKRYIDINMMTSAVELGLYDNIFFVSRRLSNFIVFSINIIIKIWPKQIGLLIDRLFHSVYNFDSFDPFRQREKVRKKRKGRDK